MRSIDIATIYIKMLHNTTIPVWMTHWRLLWGTCTEINLVKDTTITLTTWQQHQKLFCIQLYKETGTLFDIDQVKPKEKMFRVENVVQPTSSFHDTVLMNPDLPNQIVKHQTYGYNDNQKARILIGELICLPSSNKLTSCLQFITLSNLSIMWAKNLQHQSLHNCIQHLFILACEKSEHLEENA